MNVASRTFVGIDPGSSLCTLFELAAGRFRLSAKSYVKSSGPSAMSDRRLPLYWNTGQNRHAAQAGGHGNAA